jgi:hypothetical protein
MEGSRHHDDACDSALSEKRKASGGILRRGRRGRLDHELDGRSLPDRAHLLGLGNAAVRRPAGEDDDTRFETARQPLGLRDDATASRADAVSAGSVRTAAAESEDRELFVHITSVVTYARRYASTASTRR